MKTGPVNADEEGDVQEENEKAEDKEEDKPSSKQGACFRVWVCRRSYSPPPHLPCKRCRHQGSFHFWYSAREPQVRCCGLCLPLCAIVIILGCAWNPFIPFWNPEWNSAVFPKKKLIFFSFYRNYIGIFFYEFIWVWAKNLAHCSEPQFVKKMPSLTYTLPYTNI